MSKSIKSKKDTYMDSEGITHNRYLLKNILNNLYNDGNGIIHRADYNLTKKISSIAIYSNIIKITNKSPGVLIAIPTVYAKWEANANGNRGIGLRSANDDFLTASHTLGNTNGNSSRQNILYPLLIGSGETVYVGVFQDSGSVLTCELSVRILSFTSRNYNEIEITPV